MKQLDEINFLRPIIIFLLIVYHSFIIYAGGWSMPDGITDYRPYFWIAKGSYASMLEMFTLMSGYLFAHAIYGRGREYSFNMLCINKLKRLILPSVVFSTIYALCFWTESDFSINILYSMFNGIGHMWYLPMLFWCFLATYFLLKLRIKERIKIFLLVCLTIGNFFPLPLQMSRACYYILFFYLGTILYRNRRRLLQYANIQRIILIGGGT